MSTAPRVDYQTDPSRYRHWKLAFEGPVATLAANNDAAGAYLQTLQPGARSSTRHWHEREDEFLFVVLGQVTIVENDGPHVLEPGDAACWPGGEPNAHHALNESSQPCSYLIVGTRLTHDVCHYPDVGETLYTEAEDWRVEDGAGQVLRSGKVEPDT